MILQSFSLTLTFIYKVPTRLSRTIKAMFRWVRFRGTPSSPASFVSLFLSYALTHALTPAIRFTRRSVSSLSVAVRLHTDSLITSRGWAYNGLNFHSPLKTLFRIRFSVCSEPRAELRLQNRGGVGPAHYSKVVQQIRHRRRFSVPRFPQIQNVLGRAGLSREVIDVPVTHERRHRLRDYRGKWYRRLYYRRNRARLGKVYVNEMSDTRIWIKYKTLLERLYWCNDFFKVVVQAVKRLTLKINHIDSRQKKPLILSLKQIFAITMLFDLRWSE